MFFMAVSPACLMRVNCRREAAFLTGGNLASLF
jgi:hypothetical protein